MAKIQQPNHKDNVGRGVSNKVNEIGVYLLLQADLQTYKHDGQILKHSGH